LTFLASGRTISYEFFGFWNTWIYLVNVIEWFIMEIGRFSLEEALVKDTDKIHWRSLIIFLTFSLNPFVFAMGKAIHLSGVIPFLFILPIVLLLFFFMNKLVIENFNDFSTNLQELYNNYFHRFDKVLNLGLFLYGMFFISTSTALLMINILTLLRDFGITEVSAIVMFIYLMTLGAFTVLFSISNRIRNYYYLGIASIFLWFLGLIGAFALVIANSSKSSDLMSCGEFYFSSDFYHVAYIVVVPVNIIQAFNLIFRDFKETGTMNPREACLKSLKYSTLITVFAYFILGLCLGFTEEIVIYQKNAINHFDFTVLTMTVYRVFKFFWFSLQIALMMPTIKLAFLGLYYTPDSEISRLSSFLLSVFFTFVSVCVACYTYLYHKGVSESKIGGKLEECSNDKNFSNIEVSKVYLDLNIKFYAIHYLFLGTSLLGACVGLLYPWGIMIRAFKYEVYKIALTGLAAFAVIVCILLEFIYPQSKPVI
jgi:hypothetical protein